MRRGNTGPFVHCRRARVLCLPIAVPTRSLLSFLLLLSFSLSKEGNGDRKNLFALNSQRMYNGCKFSCSSATNVKRWFMGRFSLYPGDFSVHPLPSFVFAPTESLSADINQGD